MLMGDFSEVPLPLQQPQLEVSIDDNTKVT